MGAVESLGALCVGDRAPARRRARRAQLAAHRLPASSASGATRHGRRSCAFPSRERVRREPPERSAADAPADRDAARALRPRGRLARTRARGRPQRPIAAASPARTLEAASARPRTRGTEPATGPARSGPRSAHATAHRGLPLKNDTASAVKYDRSHVNPSTLKQRLFWAFEVLLLAATIAARRSSRAPTNGTRSSLVLAAARAYAGRPLAERRDAGRAPQRPRSWRSCSRWACSDPFPRWCSALSPRS